MVKKEKKSKWGMVLVIFITLIMVSSILGFIYSSSDNTTQFKYNKIKFKRTNYGWSASINHKNFLFDYSPVDVEPIELSPEISSFISNKPEIDSTSIINDTFAEEIALAEYNMNLALNKMSIYLRSGFTANNTFNLPIITCDDATYSIPVIYFMQSNETKITLQNNCIIAEARNNIDILRIKDRLLYSIVGVIG
ncbi:MAG: hypothetical protein KKC75_05220 [Nanoarchaeota archaeon]|nr:hypothetical protein [Nanoarchaeota archaeon]MBU1004224.1 hypothetical protein [Nanoarchaeota archaeon]MBU1945826.1 hypothetical protein [Nanoarchaeota archaeon]